jgi:hypothetical protein
MQLNFTDAQVQLIENLLVTHALQQRDAALRHGATTLSARPHQAAAVLANDALFVIERAKPAAPSFTASRLAGVI